MSIGLKEDSWESTGETGTENVPVLLLALSLNSRVISQRGVSVIGNECHRETGINNSGCQSGGLGIGGLSDDSSVDADDPAIACSRLKPNKTYSGRELWRARVEVNILVCRVFQLDCELGIGYLSIGSCYFQEIFPTLVIA